VRLVVGVLLAGSAGALAPAGAVAQQTLPRVLIRTDRGDIEVEVDTVRAPISGVNFLRYVDGGHFDGGQFFRTVRADNQPNDSVRIAVIQASVSAARRRDGYPPIALERTSATGLRHVDGCLSMARSRPDTATSSFSICVGDQPELDFAGRRNPDGQGFAVFGRVVRGMEVVRDIHAQPAEGQTLRPPVRILSMARA
jgi:peptidyl-prolyl cis-trans isomerase A (cyclophilin A)